MDEPMVTIPLSEYNKLRDDANRTDFFLNQVNNLENGFLDLQRRVFDLEERCRRVL